MMPVPVVRVYVSSGGKTVPRSRQDYPGQLIFIVKPRWVKPIFV